MDFRQFQELMEETYGEQDRERGIAASVAWLAEEIGELAQAIRKGSHEQRIHEFGDVLAWTASLANQVEVNLEDAIQRYVDNPP
jgi:NTP pyrophosphatase (non-canonical NTP hydrolase)